MLKSKTIQITPYGYSISEEQVFLVKRIFKEMFPSKSFIGIMCEGHSITLSSDYFIQKMDEFLGKSSVFFTGNIMIPNKNRSQENTSVLNDIYLDFDTNHGSSLFLSPLDAYYQMVDYIESYNQKNRGSFCIPKPSLVVNTGRGLQCHWFLSPVLATKNRFDLWRAIEEKLALLFKEYHCDPSVTTDYARLLRLPYTINTRANSLTEVLYFDGERYSLSDFKRMLFGDNQAPTKAQMSLISAIEAELGYSFPDKYKSSKKTADTTIKLNKHILNRESPYASNKQKKYVLDICKSKGLSCEIEKITSVEADAFIKEHKRKTNIHVNKCSSFAMNVKIYNKSYSKKMEAHNASVMEQYVKDHPYNDHCRENLLFLYRLAQLHAYDDEELAWEKTCELNNEYAQPFCESKLKRLTFSAVKYYRYDKSRWYGPNAIEDKVVGNNNADSILPYFYQAKQEKKKEYQRKYNKRYYEIQLDKDGKQKKAVEIEERREKVKELRNYGYTYAEIAKELGVSVKTIQRDLSLFCAHTEEKEDIFSSNNLLYNTIGIPSKGGSLFPNKAKVCDFDRLKLENTVFDLKKAYKLLKTFVEKEYQKRGDNYGYSLSVIDELLFVYENTDVLSTNMSIDKTVKIGLFGNAIVSLSRDTTKTKREVFSLFENTIDQGLSGSAELRHEFLMIIKSVKNIQTIENYFVSQKVRSQKQIENSIRVSKARRNIKSINVLYKTTNDYFVKEAVERFFYWWNKAKESKDPFYFDGNKYSANDLARKIFFNASIERIIQVADMIKSGTYIDKIVLALANNL